MAKTIIYQLLPRLFTNQNATNKPSGTIEENGCGKLNDINDAALANIAAMGASHVWYTGVIRHASATRYPFITKPSNTNVVKGKAGSPYAICDYYDIDPDLAENVDTRMDEWKALVNRSHAHGLKVLMDFVPNHVAREYHSDAWADVPQFGQNDDSSVRFSAQNNFYYMPGQTFISPVEGLDAHYEEMPAKASGNDAFTASPSVNDWYETVKLNYGRDYESGHGHYNPRPNTWDKMRDILLYWVNTGIDGFRVDMAEMVPVEFWRWVITQVTSRHPNIIFVAETYDTSRYAEYIAAGFNYLYDKVNFYDKVRGVITGNESASRISDIWHTTGDQDPHMLYFLENHDEQRLASDFFATDPIKGKPAYILALTMGRGATMLYAGQELGERGMDAEGFSGRDGRTTIFDYWSPEKLRQLSAGLKFDDSALTDDSRTLKEWYAKVQNVAQRYDSFSFGNFYDLMWINQHIWLDASKVYAFIRFSGSERFLVVVNFANSARRAVLRVPEDAWRLMGSTWNECITFSDILGNMRGPAPRTSVNHMKENGVELEVPAHDGYILKF